MILRGVASLFGCVVSIRSALFERGILPIYRASLPVVSVGNLTVGGTGKTPLVIEIVNRCRRLGGHPVVLSRGYGGTVTKPTRVDPLRDPPQIVGDEPLMIARHGDIPVVVSPNRVAGAKFIVEHKLGDIIILDDGFQHRWLARDLDIVAIDCSSTESCSAFLRGELLPKGRFREPLAAARRRISLVVLNFRGPRRSDDPQIKMIRANLGTLPIVEGWLTGESVAEVGSGETLLPCPVFAVTGIANPEGFLATLTAAGFTVAGSRVYPDHHPFSPTDSIEIARQAGELPVICTAKDGVKLRALWTGPLYELSASLRLEPEAPLEERLKKLLRSFTPPQVR